MFTMHFNLNYNKMKTITLLKSLFTTAIFISLASCGTSASDDSTGGSGVGSSSSSTIGGSYHILSMTSDVSVDLNNDGLASLDLLEEIDSSFFDPNNPELVIKPVIYNNQLEDLMSFYLPHANITTTNPETVGGVSFSRNGLGYVYNIDKNTQEINVDKNEHDSTSSGVMQSIEVLGQGMLKAVFKKSYYDFSSKKWVLLTITCVYKKI